jgi:acetyl esterase/lipase
MAERTGQRVISVDYRRAPEHIFPCAAEDCYCAARALYLGLTDDKIGGSAANITLAGDSAGGNLAAVVSIMSADRGEFTVKRQMLFYPATYYDHSDSSPFPSIKENGTGYLLTSRRVCDYMDLYLPDKSKRINPYFAPFLEKNPINRPRTLIVTAEYDPLRDEGEVYGAKLKKFGNDVTVYRMKNALHGFLSLPSRVVHVKKCYDIINEFLNGGAAL